MLKKNDFLKDFWLANYKFNYFFVCEHCRCTSPNFWKMSYSYKYTRQFRCYSGKLLCYTLLGNELHNVE